ncbi:MULTISPECIES: carbohydrate ABC transporter permease [unclassified Thalassospira]|jgi:glucose/mannose transport system permease protein|uniref:carbohydrate ABC transporter permease n=1 Tax=unclassified Thalassospira TaxID=2648997 RepID=UPI000A1DDB76|nr:sugar ABC transporter permease [Thalassospira sp. MCCC 1A01428]OSQ42387.1 ABC transporter permease [Thalassospira sp. MCCC 1A01428]
MGASSSTESNLMASLQRNLSKIVVAPSFAASLFFVYGFIIWTAWMAFSKSRMMPVYDWAGLRQYERLWQMERWHVAIENLLIFGGLFIVICLFLGCLLAVLLDQRIRAEGVLRTIFLYPMALSFIVTGTTWKWILNPGLGLEKMMHDLGWASFKFDWLVNSDFAIYTVVIAAVWQASGFIMAMFLAALRGVDQDIIRAAYMDGASLPRIYFGIIIPSIRPVFLSAIVVLAHLAVKSFDLVIALTGGGPGYSSDLPATFMYTMAFQRNQLGISAASAMMMLATVMAIIVPYLYSELRGGKKNG